MILQGDCLARLRELPDESVNCCVTSPPYWGLRDYWVEGQLGLEATPEEYVAHMVEVFMEVRRVLRNDGTLWLNLGDSYYGCGTGHKDTGKAVYEGKDYDSAASVRTKIKGLKSKDLVGIPWMVAFALRADGWYLRSDIVWAKPNPMPESVTDRPTRSHEYIFLLSKSQRYYYDAVAVREKSVYCDMKTSGAVYKDAHSYDRKHSDKQRGHGRRHAGFNERWDHMTKEEQGAMGRNKRDVWNVATRPFAEAHFATFPPDLIKPCILAGCPVGGVVLDPFGGSGTTGQVALENCRKFVLTELNPAYIEIAMRRLRPFMEQKKLIEITERLF